MLLVRPYGLKPGARVKGARGEEAHASSPSPGKNETLTVYSMPGPVSSAFDNLQDDSNFFSK